MAVLVLLAVGTIIACVRQFTAPPPPSPYNAATGEPHLFAALAPSGGVDRSWGQTADLAMTRVYNACRSYGRARSGVCKPDLVPPHECEAVVTPWGQSSWPCCKATAGNRADAVNAALANCTRAAAPGVPCRLAVQVCADDLV
jgi:hypothetical protein